MAGTIYEVIGRETTVGSDSSIDVLWKADGAADESEVAALLSANVPAILNGLVIQNYKIKELGADIWEIPIHYGQFRFDRPAEQQVSDTAVSSSLSFTTAGGTKKVMQSKGTTRYPSNAADFGGAIGVTGSGASMTVEGVDAVDRVFNFTWTTVIAAANVTLAYAMLLGDITGTVNNGTWKGFPSGSLRFDGVDGSLRNNQESELGFKFAYSKNVTGLVVGSITGISKLGWEYLWVRYKQDTSADTMVRKPLGVYVEKIYEYTNFGALGIGT